MYSRKEKIENIFIMFFDLISLLASYLLAGLLWMGGYKGYSDVEYIVWFLFRELWVILIAYVGVALFFNSNADFMKRGAWAEFKCAFKSNLVIGAIIGTISFVRHSLGMSRGAFILTIPMNIFFMFGLHMLLKMYLYKIRKSNRGTNALYVITTSDRVDKVLAQINNNGDWTHKLRGIILIDDNRIGEQIGGVKIVATYTNMLDYLKKDIADEVFISVPYDTGKGLRHIIMELQSMGAAVHLNIEALEEFTDFNKTLSMVGNIPAVTFANNFFDYNKLFVKRIIDIVGAIVGIVLTCIVTIFVAPFLLIESPGPLIFKQKRVGKNGRYFYIYKFRSMYMDAEERKKELMDKNEMSGLMFKMTDDPRVTKVGKFIRKTSIDELPQFFNVLKGDMSLVGTRPPTVDEFKQYEGYHKRRLSMKPGITGLWQVSGRSDIEDFEEVVKLDFEYIDNWCVSTDIKILLKTVGVILFGKGAK